MSDQEKCQGVKADGSPCTRAAGWGTGTTEGPCRYHTAEALGKKQVSDAAIKKAVTASLERGDTIPMAAEDAGCSEKHIWQLRSICKKFGAEVDKLLDADRMVRLRLRRLTEGAMTRALRGDVGQTLEMFLIQNLARRKAKATGDPLEWVNVHTVEDISGTGLKVPMGAVELAQERLDAAEAAGDLGEEYLPPAVAARISGNGVKRRNGGQDGA